MGEVIKNDVPALARWVAAQRIGLIVFDGFPGAGKMTLAKDLAGRFRCRTVDADLFLEKKRDRFVEALRLPELTAEIRIAMELSRFVLFSSTCARQVADRIGFGAKAFVYVLLLTPEGEVNGKYALQAEDEFDLAELEGEGLSPLDIEVRKYHWNRKPRRTADVIYERTYENVRRRSRPELQEPRVYLAWAARAGRSYLPLAHGLRRRDLPCSPVDARASPGARNCWSSSSRIAFDHLQEGVDPEDPSIMDDGSGALNTVQHQLLLAGIRLAFLLDQNFGKP